MSLLISSEELVGDLGNPVPPVVLDVRWTLSEGADHESYLSRHIPEALFVDIDNQLSGTRGKRFGRHSLPSIDKMTRNLRVWGVRAGRKTVVYDNSSSVSASRAWWLLRWAGVNNAKILDGGLRAYLSRGRRWAAGPGLSPRPSELSMVAGQMPVIDIDEAATWPDKDILLDVRAPARYRGEIEPIDSQAGHIPGAINAPTLDNVDNSGFFLPREELRSRFEKLGIDENAKVAVYCGSGVSAAHTIAALELAGFPGASLFAGGWSQWSGQGLPINRGSTP